MTDKNGREIMTGDVVRVTGGYFKNDNGLFFVSNSPGDPNWCGNDHSLRKLNLNGSLSVSKYNVSFWPLCSYVSDRIKTARANDWNKANAKIEVIEGVDRSAICRYFSDRADGLKATMDRWGHVWGKHSGAYVSHVISEKFYRGVASRIG